MQSFGEGLDLPGALCASLFITKLPFAPPRRPGGEARAEWLRSSGRNPFTDLVVPATAIRLAQWVGRAIRTEHDQAQVYCYDRRLRVHQLWPANSKKACLIFRSSSVLHSLRTINFFKINSKKPWFCKRFN